MEGKIKLGKYLIGGVVLVTIAILITFFDLIGLFMCLEGELQWAEVWLDILVIGLLSIPFWVGGLALLNKYIRYNGL